MSGNLIIPNTFQTQSGNVPASEIDDDFTAARDYVNNREVTIGLIAARPAAGISGRWYLATDVNGGTLFVDNGLAWVQGGINLAAGTGITLTPTGATLQISSTATPSFTPSFTSAATAFTLGSVTTIPHGLGSLPPLARCSLRCASGEGGYSVGDEFDLVGTVSEQNAADRAGMWAIDATNVTVIFGISLNPFQKNVAASFALTAANWRLIVRAWI